MALLWIDGFDTYGTTTGSAPSPAGIVGRKYAATTGENYFRVGSGRLGGYSLNLPNDSIYFGAASLTATDTVVAGFAVRFAAIGTRLFFALYDGATLGVNLTLTPAGEIVIKCGSTTLATSSNAAIAINTWYYVELKVKCHSTTGTFELRVGGIAVSSGSGVDTQAGANSYHDGFRFLGQVTSSSMYLDDFYFLDSSGSVNNDFLGNRRIVTLYPDAAGDSTDFTPDSGSNYARVNEAVSGDDADYVEDSTAGHKDLYGYAALSGVESDIAGVQVTTDCRETDATNFTLITVCKSATTESDDAGQAIGTTSYTSKRRIIETDPDTAAAWTTAGVDAAQFGIKVG